MKEINLEIFPYLLYLCELYVNISGYILTWQDSLLFLRFFSLEMLNVLDNPVLFSCMPVSEDFFPTFLACRVFFLEIAHLNL